jgi:hypothetical protein
MTAARAIARRRVMILVKGKEIEKKRKSCVRRPKTNCSFILLDKDVTVGISVTVFLCTTGSSGAKENKLLITI